MPKNKFSQKELLGDRWPKALHPATGEPFDRCERVETDHEVVEMNTLPPEAPTREVYEWDEDIDMPVQVGTLTEEEYQAALKRHKEELRKWHDNGGRIRLSGQTTTTARFVTKSGAWAEGTYLGEERDPAWAWTRWSGVEAGVSRETCGR